MNKLSTSVALTAILILLLFFVANSGKAQTFNATDEASVYVGNVNNNYGATTFQVKDATTGGKTRIGYIKFNLGATTSAQVGTATLRLYCTTNGTPPTTVNIYNTSSDWNEGTITYGNRPNFLVPLSSSSITGANSYIEWDVTNYVRELVKNNAVASFGLSDDGKSDNQIIFYTKENGSANLPQLVISTTPNPNPANDAPLVPNQLFSNNMVMQQSKTDVPVYGKAGIGSTITVTPSWNNIAYTATADINGAWKVNVATPAANTGGPYTINIHDTDGHTANITNVQIGEVWFCAGQSNMEMKLRGFSSGAFVENSDAIVAASNDPNLRVFTLPYTNEINPQADCSGSWIAASPSTTQEFSAIAYIYAKELKAKLGVPIGMIVSAVGGTPIQAWMSKGSLQPFPEVPIPTTIDNGNSTTTSLFNGMVNPIAGFGIKGFLWYQGESNRQEPYLYKKLFPALITDYRAKWNNNNLPFYFVQLAPNNYSMDTIGGPRFREMQYNVYQAVANTGISIPMEVGEASQIHYADKTTPAQRLSYIALNKTYGYTSIPYLGPEYQSVSFTGNVATLSFNYADGLQFKGNSASLFEIAGADKVFYPATAVINISNQIEVSSPNVPNPVAVRYAFSNFVVGNLFNGDNLPASSFRTINWDPEAALPIELITFTGKATNNGIALKWITASEKNNNQFEILKSTDGKNFKVIANVKGAGNSNQKLFYNFTDLALISGINYYQLKQIDFDGTSSASAVIAIKYSLNDAKLSVYPNPATDELNIQLPESGYNDNLQLTLTDLSGKIILFKTIPANQNNIKLSVSAITKGVYLLQLTEKNGAKLLTEKVVLK